MIRDLEEAVAQLRREPARPVLAEVDGLVVELRLRTEVGGTSNSRWPDEVGEPPAPRYERGTPSQGELLASIRRRRWRAPAGTPDSTTLLREDRDR